MSNGNMAVLEVEEKKITLGDVSPLKVELGDYLKTYVDQYNQMVETYDWMKDRLSRDQQREWDSTISSLKTICLALGTGFEPRDPPRNWGSGLLFQYRAPIPKEVRESIDKAEPIFGRQQILIYDPNPEHFQRPKHTDPIVIGFVNLVTDRINFLIGQWDIKADLSFIKGTRAGSAVRRTQSGVREMVDLTKQLKQMGNTGYWTKWVQPSQQQILPQSIGTGYVSTTDVPWDLNSPSYSTNTDYYSGSIDQNSSHWSSNPGPGSHLSWASKMIGQSAVQAIYSASLNK